MLSSNEVNMTQALRIILAILTLLTVLGCAAGAVWSFATGKPALLGVVCTLLAGGFGVFSYNDYKYFFGKKS
jgi:hypothetical protein